MPFERYAAGSGRGATSEPRISVRKTDAIGINSAAMDEWFDDATAVNTYYDEETNAIGLEPLAEAEGGSYALQDANGSGTVAAGGFLNGLGLSHDVTTTYEPTWDDEHEMVVISLDDPVRTVGSPDADAESSSE